jgi:uncharacterized DUF497 family protein
VEFEWDAKKARENLQKHKVSFAEACESFEDPQGFVLEDTEHSKEEDRFYWVGKSSSGRILTTRFTMRRGNIRIIGSAEWREFREIYNEKTKSEKS